jgi:pyruvate dehydrogenase E1 component
MNGRRNDGRVHGSGRAAVGSGAGDRAAPCPPPDLDVLEQIARRVLWLAVRMVDTANRDRDTGDGVKVGGHQASCASLVPAMTALYFAPPRPQ